ncbi:SHOCT domain-containing protein [Piscinibacter koreensis]|uniref:SHOCT domain-containing protein n=1 Tax=Piscinibacter koreensis TaxID=2742824 RepID=A0A7Y6NMM6_9BURK|nr:SHOCT domain-containing protein [Schlegelella koreensis]NUZ05857.1 SHOCT domain-containing protein [Schlegelella koreensis]
MPATSADDERALADIAVRHGFSVDAAREMVAALQRGWGSMAQFDHPEFGGYGQWLRGGMTMIGDMFNASLRNRVDALATDLAAYLAGGGGQLVAPAGAAASAASSATLPAASAASTAANASRAIPAADPTWPSPAAAPAPVEPAPEAGATRPAGGPSQFQRQGDARSAASVSSSPGGGFPAFREFGNWWPDELSGPSSTGAQNEMRYAYFGDQRRLAIDDGRTVTVYDTLDHRIGGFSQQQSATRTMTMSSQHGPIDIASLPVVSTAPSRR